jgi:heme-degrading monooxygenase HmoA
MYGTVARLSVNPGAAEKLLQFSRGEVSRNIPGFVFQYIYQMDQDAREYLLVVGFTDKART